MMSGLAEELIVPEANGSSEKLRRWDRKCRMPEQVVKTSGNPPCPERMEQHMIGIARFVRVVFVKQFSIFAARLQQPAQFLS